MDNPKTQTPWLRVVRLPNLLTVPGDPVAGCLLAVSACPHPALPSALLAVVGASLCLYVFGLILNDIMDVETDLVERPTRPLPAGEITVPQARMAAIAMALSGLNLALVAGWRSLCCAGILAGLIIAYNAGLKRVPVVGVLSMGVCRGLSLLLGAVAARPQIVSEWDAGNATVLVAAVGLVLYVAGLSAVAKREMDPEKPLGQTRWLPFVALLAVLPVLLPLAAAHRTPDPFTPTVYVFLMVMALMRAWLLGGVMYRLQPVPDTVGGHIRNLLMVQACFCLAAGRIGLFPAILFVLCALVFARLARFYYSS